MNYKKENYNKLIDLFMKNEALIKKEAEIDYLIKSCKNDNEKSLVFSLLEKLVFITLDKYNLLMESMIDYIIDLKLNYPETQITATAMDDEADSSQSVLQALKQKLAAKEISDFTTVNKFHKSIQHYNKGKTNIIVVDEFVGSGKTVLNRLNLFKERIGLDKKHNIHFVYLAGIESSINKLKSEGINIFCAYPLKKGISDHYEGEDFNRMSSAMLDIELRLAQNIKEKNIFDYSFGYGNAEALYTAENCLNNTPNSVFPIFWWKKDMDNNNRKTILTRYETGF